MPCPICDKETDPAYRPFCSRRCADIDLGKWLTEGYRIPDDDPAETEDAAPSDDPDRAPRGTPTH